MAERTVQFWQLTEAIGGQSLGGRFPATTVAAKVGGLSGRARYAELHDGMRVLGKMESTSTPCHLVLCRVRRDNVPAIEEDGNLADIQLTSRQNVAEETHVLFLPRNVVGVLYNHEGPRISRLVEYLRDRFGILVSISPVLDSATARRLAKMGTFTSVEMTIPVSRANLLSEDPAEVAVAVRQMAAASLSRTVHVKAVIQGTPGQRRWRNWVEDVVRSPRLEAFTKLKVHSRKSDLGDPPQTVDFVKEQLVMREAVHMQANRSRRVQPSSAKAAIRDAYAHLETQIGDAVAPVGDVDLTIEDLT